jgi:hypothetical protein
MFASYTALCNTPTQCCCGRLHSADASATQPLDTEPFHQNNFDCCFQTMLYQIHSC